MTRATCAVAALLALAVPRQPDVDAIKFAKAFQEGFADQYKSRQISGTGMSFHGSISERLADGSTRRSLVITLGEISGGVAAPLETWDSFLEAETAHKTLVVALSGPDLPDVPSRPVTIRFTGVYDGQVRTIMRQAGSVTPDRGACPGEQPPSDVHASFYCAPLLTGATAAIVSR